VQICEKFLPGYYSAGLVSNKKRLLLGPQRRVFLSKLLFLLFLIIPFSVQEPIRKPPSDGMGDVAR